MYNLCPYSRDDAPLADQRFLGRVIHRFLECFQFNTHMVEAVLGNRLIAPDAETRIWKDADKFAHGEFVENVRLGSGIYPTLVRTSNLPGDDDKRDPERENWPCRVMLPILPIQSISGSRLL